jgi:hypothetical protein
LEALSKLPQKFVTIQQPEIFNPADFTMSDSVQDPNASLGAEQSEKGKGRAADQNPAQQSEDEEEDEEEDEVCASEHERVAL